ncbi:MAG: MFS transporter [Planctomycetota bacterium]
MNRSEIGAASAATSLPASGGVDPSRRFGVAERLGRFGRRHWRSVASPTEARRKQLVLVTLAWLFGSAWLAIATSAVAIQYGRSLGVAEWGFGLLAAVPFIGAIAQLPVAYAMERWGHRRTLFLVTALSGRLMWIAAGLVPWLVPDVGPAWAIAYGGCCVLGWLLQQACGPAWMNWMGDVIPRPIRGRYMALRGNLGTLVLVITSFVSAWLLDRSGVLQSWWGLSEGDALLVMGSGLMIAAGVVGAIDICWFLPMPDRHATTANPDARLLGTLAEPLRDRRLWPYLGFFLVFNLSIGYVPTYVALYLIDECGFTTAGVNTLMFSIPPIMTMLAMPFWGRFIDRHGKKPTMMIAGWVICVGGGGWLFMTPERWLLPYAVMMAVVMAWAAVQLAMVNFMLDLGQTSRPRRSDAARAADGRSTEQFGGAPYLAVCSLAGALGGGLSGVFGAAIAGWLHDLRLEVSWIGITLTYHGVLLIISMALRGVSILFVSGFHEPEANSATAALRYTSSAAYASLRDLTVIPGRYARRSVRGIRLQVISTRRTLVGRGSGRSRRAA